MFPLVTLLAGLLTAASSQSDEQSRRLREDALRSRLGLEGATLFRHLPLIPGVTIWAWADGDRITRLVTESQVEIALKLVGEHLEDTDGMLDAVSAHDNEGFSDLPGIEVVQDDMAVYAYFDVHNRLHALWYVETFGDDKPPELQELAGTGTIIGEIEGIKARSRIFQFLREVELDDNLVDVDGARMWWDDILVPAGVLEAMDQIDAGKSARDLNLTDRNVRDYVFAYQDLVMQLAAVRGELADMERISKLDPHSKEMYDLLEEEGYLDELEEWGYDLYSSDEPFAEVPDDVVREQQQRVLRHRFDNFRDDGALIELESAVANEAEELNLLLPHHRLHRGGRTEGSQNSWELYSSEHPAHEDAILDDMRFYVQRRTTINPYWVVQGHSGKKGLLRRLQESSFLETERELYDKAPEEPVAEWPGPNPSEYLEGLRLVGSKQAEPVHMTLTQFLLHSYDHGLLHPDVVDQWAPLLAHHGRTVPSAMVTPPRGQI